MKITNKLFVFLLSIIILFSFSVTVFAQGPYTNLVDDADLFTSSEENEISKLLEDFTTQKAINMIVITTDTLGFSKPTDTTSYDTEYMLNLARGYSENYYSSQGLSYDSDGLVLLRYINEYDKYISIISFGELKDVFDEDLAYELTGKILDDLTYNSNSAYEGIIKYLDLVEYEYENKDSLSLKTIFIALVIALIISLIIVLGMKSQLKSVKNQDFAKDYLKKGSFKLTNSKDTFLYNTVTKVKIESNSSSRGGGGGHSRSGGGGRRG